MTKIRKLAHQKIAGAYDMNKPIKVIDVTLTWADLGLTELPFPISYYGRYFNEVRKASNIPDLSVRRSLLQELYCNYKELPMFAPGSGVCGWCGKQIYTMISDDKAANSLITGCPFCNHSYCE